MVEKNVAFCPTLAAGDATSQYAGWKKGVDPEPARLARKRATFKAALDAGVKMCFGGDVGVYAHGDNVRELELMVEYGHVAGSRARRGDVWQRVVLPAGRAHRPRQAGTARGSDRRRRRSRGEHQGASPGEVRDEGREGFTRSKSMRRMHLSITTCSLLFCYSRCGLALGGRPRPRQGHARHRRRQHAGSRRS